MTSTLWHAYTSIRVLHLYFDSHDSQFLEVKSQKGLTKLHAYFIHSVGFTPWVLAMPLPLMNVLDTLQWNSQPMGHVHVRSKFSILHFSVSKVKQCIDAINAHACLNNIIHITRAVHYAYRKKHNNTMQTIFSSYISYLGLTVAITSEVQTNNDLKL